MDRAALDVADELHFRRGGWCPRGRLAEDGPLSPTYPVTETPSSNYVERTRWNVRDSDGTLILAVGPLSGGTALTARAAEKRGRPLHVVDLDGTPDVARVVEWIRTEGIETLNVAGPRESGVPGIYGRAAVFLRKLLGELRAEDPQ